MTAVALHAAAPRPWAVPLVLGLQEGRRIVLHPLALLGLFLTVLPIIIVGDNGPRDAFEVFLIGPGSYYGVLVYFAAWFVASRDRRGRRRGGRRPGCGRRVAAEAGRGSSPETDRHRAAQAAERICAAVRRRPFR